MQTEAQVDLREASVRESDRIHQAISLMSTQGLALYTQLFCFSSTNDCCKCVIELEDLEEEALKIQKNIRRWLTKKNYSRMRDSVNILQRGK